MRKFCKLLPWPDLQRVIGLLGARTDFAFYYCITFLVLVLELLSKTLGFDLHLRMPISIILSFIGAVAILSARKVLSAFSPYEARIKEAERTLQGTFKKSEIRRLSETVRRELLRLEGEGPRELFESSSRWDCFARIICGALVVVCVGTIILHTLYVIYLLIRSLA